MIYKIKIVFVFLISAFCFSAYPQLNDLPSYGIQWEEEHETIDQAAWVIAESLHARVGAGTFLFNLKVSGSLGLEVIPKMIIGIEANAYGEENVQGHSVGPFVEYNLFSRPNGNIVVRASHLSMDYEDRENTKSISIENGSSYSVNRDYNGDSVALGLFLSSFEKAGTTFGLTITKREQSLIYEDGSMESEDKWTPTFEVYKKY